VIIHVQMVTPMLCHELFQNLSCTNFMEVKSVMDEFIGSTVTNLQLVCHFINSCPPVIKNQCVDSFSVDGCPAHFLSVALVWVPLNVISLIYDFLQHNTVTILC
jgi:hypothetical protein